MEKDFIPYEQALALKELGFDEPCFNYYSTPNHPSLQPAILLGNNPSEPLMSSQMYKIGVWKIKAPLYQQAFRWFREKYALLNHLTTHLNPYGEDGALEESYGYRIMRNNDGWKCSLWEELSNYDYYEEAELECLKKLIEIVKQK